jgi:transposase
MSRVYAQEFKEDAVRLLERSGRSYTQVSADLGVSYWTLRNWYRDLRMGKRLKKGRSARAAAAPVVGETLEEKVQRLERENAQLRKERDSLEMDRAILKKAAAFFAKESE